MRKYRRAQSEAREDQEITVSIYTGSKTNGEKLREVCDLMHRLDEYSPTMPIEAFLVPVPSDPQAADVLRQSLIRSIEDIFDSHDPEYMELN